MVTIATFSESKISCPYTFRINKEYPLYLGEGTLSLLNDRVRSYRPGKVFVIIDSNVNDIYGKKIMSILKTEFDSHRIIVPAGEENKNPTAFWNICNQLLENGISKNSFIVIVGGGVTGNMAGFAASVVMRGIPFGYLPTTVMAQADSTTGGKQAINTTKGKNLIGIFNDPKFIIADIDFLRTLPLREVHCGIAECIKHGLCQDKEFITFLSQNLKDLTPVNLKQIIDKTINLKIRTLLIDPLEINEGKILVYGHTIGHAVEILSQGKLNHGESISIGMMCAAKLSVMLGYASPSLVSIHKKILSAADLPLYIPKYLDIDSIMHQLKFDKKISDSLEFVLLSDIGKVVTVDGKLGIPVKASMIRKVLEWGQE